MLRNVADAMDPAASTMLIVDWVDPPSFGTARPRMLDMLDLHMIANTNVASRGIEEWDGLLRAADERLVRGQTATQEDGIAVMQVTKRPL